MSEAPKHPSLTLEEPQEGTLEQLRRLNSVVFPVSYSNRFYDAVMACPMLSSLAHWNGMLVGAMCSRFERVQENPSFINQYIMTLGVLAPYRRLGIGGVLLQEALRIAKECCGDKTVHKIFLHVQSNNDTALEFYKKHGFEVKELLENYYARIEPSSCYVVERVLNPMPERETQDEEA